MRITVNGEDTAVGSGTSLADLVAATVPGRGRGVAVACNGEVIPRSRWPDAVLADGDHVEVLTAAQGG